MAKTKNIEGVVNQTVISVSKEETNKHASPIANIVVNTSVRRNPNNKSGYLEIAVLDTSGNEKPGSEFWIREKEFEKGFSHDPKYVIKKKAK